MVISTIFSSGCNIQPTLQELAHKDADVIFELIKNEDIDKLSQLFSNEVKQEHDLKEEWQSFFENIDGNIVDYDDISYGAESEGYNEGKLYKQSICVILEKPKTDTGTVYEEIVYYQTRVFTKNPDREGINGLKLLTSVEEGEYNYLYVGLSE